MSPKNLKTRCLWYIWQAASVSMIEDFLSGRRQRVVCVAFEGYMALYMCLGYTPDGIVLVGGYCVTCLDLLFSKRSRTLSIFRRKVADHAH